MSFTNSFFLIGLLPWFVILCNLFKKSNKIKVVLLFLANSIFYMWGGVGVFLFMLLYVFSVWLFVKVLHHTNNKYLCGVIVVLTSMPLILCKYVNIFIDMINSLGGQQLRYVGYVVPLGISFITFEALSLIFDIYRRKIGSKVSLLDTYLYLTFFVTVSSGPIIRYLEFEKGFGNQIILDKYNDAIVRIVIGLCKKVLIANKLAPIVAYYFDGTANGYSFSTIGLWVGSIAFTMQLYFDFSGYSDMALGIGSLLGYEISENFNRPYTARSISDFWKRWHISLTSWFRDYVYIPLGGNRCSAIRHIFNLLIVWILTSIWHGSEMTFIVWGMGYFIMLLLEKKLAFAKKIEKSVIGHIYSLFLINILWVPFRAINISTMFRYIKGMFIYSTLPIEEIVVDYIPYTLIAVSVCLIYGWISRRSDKVCHTVREIMLVALFILAICATINSSYMPYIYGNF